jgi:hypothetical protein
MKSIITMGRAASETSCWQCSAGRHRAGPGTYEIDATPDVEKHRDRKSKANTHFKTGYINLETSYTDTRDLVERQFSATFGSRGIDAP